MFSRTYSSARTRIGVALVVVIALLTGLTLALTSNAASSQTPPHSKTARLADWPSGPKPTIVLVHGAWADSSSWDGVIQLLQGQGFSVVAEPNPLHGLTSDSEFLADFLQSIPGPIVLVGHSYGGMVVTNAATGNPNVKALVYVDAFIPAQGETAFQLVDAKPGSCLNNPDPSQVFNVTTFPGAPAGDYEAYVKASVFTQCFANDLSPSQAAVAAAVQRPLTLDAGGTPSGVPAWQTIPSWAVVGTIDHVIPPAEQLFMAQRAGAHITELRASHLSMVSQPCAVANVILQAARATR